MTNLDTNFEFGELYPIYEEEQYDLDLEAELKEFERLERECEIEDDFYKTEEPPIANDKIKSNSALFSFAGNLVGLLWKEPICSQIVWSAVISVWK